MLEFERRYGGLQWGAPPEPSQLGVASLLLEPFPTAATTPGKSTMTVNWKNGEAMLVGTTATTELFLTEDGTLLERDFLEGCLFPSATSVAVRIETEAMLFWAAAMKQYCEEVVAGNVAEQMAGKLGLKRIDEASDTIRTWYADEACSLQAHFSVITGERATAIFTTTQAKLDAVLALR